MYSTIPIHWNIKSAPTSPGSVGPALYVFSFLAYYNSPRTLERGTAMEKFVGLGEILSATYNKYIAMVLSHVDILNLF
jgi:hypothetical protein